MALDDFKIPAPDNFRQYFSAILSVLVLFGIGVLIITNNPQAESLTPVATLIIGYWFNSTNGQYVDSRN